MPLSNFVVVFVLSAAFMAYAPGLYRENRWVLRKNMSNVSLTLGTKIVFQTQKVKEKSSIKELMRDSLFFYFGQSSRGSLLQYGNSDVESIAANRIESLLSTNPDENKGRTGK